MNRTRRAALAACPALAAALVLTLAGAAHAHVTIDPGEAEQGSYATLNVRVPNERDNASTVELELHLDPDHPVASVMPQPVPGWEVEVESAELDEPLEVHGSEITEAPSVITWTGGEIEPGTFQQFPISVGPLPEDADRLVFDAIQTYSNDEVVRWIEEPVDGGEEPELPSPLLELVPAAEDSADAAASDADDDASDAAESDDAGETGADDGESAAADSDDGDAGGTDTTARVLGVAGLLVGAAGLAFGVLAARRRPAASPATPPTA